MTIDEYERVHLDGRYRKTRFVPKANVWQRIEGHQTKLANGQLIRTTLDYWRTDPTWEVAHRWVDELVKP